MEEIWQRIELWLKINQPDILSSLSKGATKDKISALEKDLNIKFPEPFHKSVAIHDGQREGATALIDGWELLPLIQIKKEWKVWKGLLDDGEFTDINSAPEAGIKNDWWNERWIPIATDGAGNNLCLDLDPASGGTYGQVITLWHDSDERKILFRSFEEWLRMFASWLEAGKITYLENDAEMTSQPELKAGGVAIELRQKHLNERREFFLQEQRIRTFTKDLDGEFEAYIKYENLTDIRRTLTKQDGRLFITAISCGIFGLIGLASNLFGEDGLMRWAPLWVVACLVFFAFYYYKRRRYLLIDLDNNTSFFFLYDNPSKEKLEAFLTEMFKAQKHYLRKFYLHIPPGYSEESEINKFRWLLQKNAISEEEFAHWVGLLKDKQNHTG